MRQVMVDELKRRQLVPGSDPAAQALQVVRNVVQEEARSVNDAR